MYFAAVIILLHSFIAHSHHEDSKVSFQLEEVHQSNSIVDFIAIGFHVEHAEGQLTNFTASNHLQIDQKISFQHFTVVPVIAELESDSVAKPLFDHSSNLIDQLNGRFNFVLRGPPSLS